MAGPDVSVAFEEALRAERRGRFDAAIDLYRTIAEQSSGANSLDARLRLGKLLVRRGQVEEAVLVLQQARDQARVSSSPRKHAVAIHLTALAYRHRDPAEARRLLEDNSPLAIPGAPGSQLGQWLHYLGPLDADRNDLAAAERRFHTALDYYREASDRIGMAEVYDSLANLLLASGKTAPAQEFAARSLELKEAFGDLYGQAISHGTIGRAFLLQARYAEAEASFRRDLDLAERLQDRPGIGIMLNSLGAVELQRRNFKAAASWYRKNLERRTGGINEAHAWAGSARVHLAAGNLDDAEAAWSEGQAVLARTGDSPELEAVFKGIRGALEARRGRHAEGERLLREAIDALRRGRFELDTLPWLHELRDLFQKQGKVAEAVRLMSQALDLLSECGADEEISDLESWLRTVDSPALTRLALERHFPGHLVEAILGGELTRRHIQRYTRRQKVSVLFTDVRNYTTLSEGLAPEEVLNLLNEWFAETTHTIRRFGGVVDKFIGDGIMALFGVPDPRDDCGADAVRAALGITAALRARNLRHRALGGREIQVGIGVHTGEAVVGFVGSHLRYSYTAIGDTVNTASRLESATKAYPDCDILISRATEEAQQARHVAETEAMGLAELKGHSPMEVFKVIGPRAGAEGH